ncbi:MAG: cytochrome c maturation protein CcmE [Rhizobiales bacterium]|nr:cytochrome c maturation protein CcmE [Hyphomicrobiales bacterium]NRB13375.1 cytochrome c maturation protein CcmE [Hyphomicrobiales bacterium]
MTRKQQRFTFIIVGLLLLGVAIALILTAMKDGISFFKTPTQIMTENLDPTTRLRIGGLVVIDSIERQNEVLTFQITDNNMNLNISYKGVVPDLFKQGQGVVLEGYLTPNKLFVADSLLAKHDENYMPKEVADSLKDQGHWQGQTPPTND